MRQTILAGLTLVAVSIGASAPAAILFTSSPLHGSSPAPGEAMVETFDGPMAVGYAWSGLDRSPWNAAANADGNLFAGGVVGYAGYLPGNGTTFAAVFGRQTATLGSSRLLHSLSVDIGSIDSYNFLDFYRGELWLGTISGMQLSSQPDGSWTGGAQNRRFAFSGELFDRLAFRSAGNSFEFDNIAAAEIDEPAAFGLLGLGVASLALTRRRRARRATG